MAVALLPYETDDYNSLPELYTARDQFNSRRASDILYTEIGKVFVKHNVQDILGNMLLHNHFLLEPYERLVSVNSVAVPWDIRSGAKEFADVHPTSWRFTEKGIVPYEFTHAVPATLFDGQDMQAFLLELNTVLAKRNLMNILGIYFLGNSPIDSPRTMEFTSGRVNITLPFDIAPDDGNVTDAMWQFRSKSEDTQARQDSTNQPIVVGGQCKGACKGEPHAERHIFS